MGSGRVDVVGLVPAAGQGHRIAPLPCSKELFPVGFGHDPQSGEPRPKVASHYLFDKFRAAGITSAYVVLRQGKWDIPAYFGEGREVGLHLAYLVIPESLGPPDTLDRAYPFLSDRAIAFGFPDILFGPDDVFARLLERLRATGADIVLGLYRAHDCRLMDMVDVDAAGRVRAIVLKPASSDLRYAWVCAVWTPVFTACMHGFLAAERARPAADRTAYRAVDQQGDLPVGVVIRFALETGVRVHGLAFEDETYIDIGTPADLVKAVAHHARSAAGGRS